MGGFFVLSLVITIVLTVGGFILFPKDSGVVLISAPGLWFATSIVMAIIAKVYTALLEFTDKAQSGKGQARVQVKRMSALTERCTAFLEEHGYHEAWRFKSRLVYDHLAYYKDKPTDEEILFTETNRVATIIIQNFKPLRFAFNGRPEAYAANNERNDPPKIEEIKEHPELATDPAPAPSVAEKPVKGTAEPQSEAIEEDDTDAFADVPEADMSEKTSNDGSCPEKDCAEARAWINRNRYRFDDLPPSDIEDPFNAYRGYVDERELPLRKDVWKAIKYEVENDTQNFHIRLQEHGLYIE